MRKVLSGMAVAVLALLVFSFSPKSHAQNAQGGGAPGGGGGRGASATANLPFDAHDFSGVWGAQTFAGPNRTLSKEEPPMNAAGLAFYKAQRTEFQNPPADGPENTDPI